MEERTASVQLDPLLLPFIEATDEAAARAHLEELLALVAPSIKKISGKKVTGGKTSNPFASSEDDSQESYQQIIKALWQCRSDPQRHAIGDFQRYVTVVAAHVARRRWRTERPAYHALRESLRHTLRNDARFSLWEVAERGWLCGLTIHDGQSAATSSSRLTELLQQPSDCDEAILPGRDAQQVSQAELLDAIFVWLGHPVGFDALVKIVFALRRMEEAIPVTESDDDDARPWSETMSGSEAAPDEEAEWRQFLEKLWAEIEQLPPLQRIAYLLNFTAGNGSLEIFWLYGVASVRRIGATLGLSDEQFARAWAEYETIKEQAERLTGYDEKFALLWRYLPLNDQTIARLIGTERQKVINLRKAAGDRLARRLAMFQAAA
ncbi:MAG: hypothetical protein ABI977_07545 [Acidobacteriota bacterium]